MKNEQIILVVLAYVIGFTTAFIAFSLDNKKEHINFVEAVDVKRVANVAQASSVSILNNEEGLFVSKDGEERILSGKVLGVSTEDGFHTGIASTNISPDGLYVHYCAEMDEGDNSCVNFIYSVAEDKVFKLSFDQDLSVSSDTNQNVFWLSSNTLSISGHEVSAANNWK